MKKLIFALCLLSACAPACTEPQPVSTVEERPQPLTDTSNLSDPMHQAADSLLKGK